MIILSSLKVTRLLKRFSVIEVKLTHILIKPKVFYFFFIFFNNGMTSWLKNQNKNISLHCWIDSKNMLAPCYTITLLLFKNFQSNTNLCGYILIFTNWKIRYIFCEHLFSQIRLFFLYWHLLKALKLKFCDFREITE